MELLPLARLSVFFITSSLQSALCYMGMTELRLTVQIHLSSLARYLEWYLSGQLEKINLQSQTQKKLVAQTLERFLVLVTLLFGNVL
jgi:hypothetical protein